ncbi:MAG: hypothetical protein ACPG8F_04850 [Flavobacteriaceae bacterium]
MKNQLFPKEFLDQTVELHHFRLQPHSNLLSGIKGSLTKGLTLTALFYQAHRSLFQLLYDDVIDWINPNQSNSIQNDLFP